MNSQFNCYQTCNCEENSDMTKNDFLQVKFSYEDIYQKDTYKHVKANQKRISNFLISYIRKYKRSYSTLVHEKESDPIRTLKNLPKQLINCFQKLIMKDCCGSKPC